MKSGFEDLTTLALAPLLRRLGLFMIHAFTAALSGKAVMFVGPSGSGKTSCGLALASAGWQILANDVALMQESGGPSRAFIAWHGTYFSHYINIYCQYTKTCRVNMHVNQTVGKSQYHALSFWRRILSRYLHKLKPSISQKSDLGKSISPRRFQERSD